MAYPTVSGPYGFVPVNAFGGRQFAGSTRMVPIVNAYGTGLYNGDPIAIGTGANIGCAVTTGLTYNQSAIANGQIGIFVGCEYSATGGPIYGKNRYQYWKASTAATDAVAYVVDDPWALFKVCVLNGGSGNTSTLQYVNQAYVGANVYYVPGAGGSQTTGNSGAGVAITTAATSTSAITPATTANAPFRIVQIVPETAVNVVQSCTSNSTTLTIPSSGTNSAILPGMAVNGPGITVGSNTYVTTVNGSTITVNTAVATNQATATNFTFTGYPEVIVGWNFGHHAYLNGTGV